MDWRVLGPIEVLANGSPISLGGRQRRLVLAILLANADQTVSTDRVIDEVWGGSSPDSARKTIQAHVAHLRRALNGDSEFLSSSGDGYRVSPDVGSFDADRFEEALMAARRSADPKGTVDLLDQALDMFRGEPYAGLADDALTVKVEASRLNELRLNAKEERLEALLALGDAPGVAAEADSLLAEHPLREQLWALRMLALYRSGRQSEALRSFSRARHILAEELGIEPSNALQALEQRILEQDASLSDSKLATASAARTVDVRRNPYKGLRAFDAADAGDFFGRAELVRQLVDRLTTRPPASLTVLAGPSGAGKSSVLRAGLLPALYDRGLVVADMFPGEEPELKLDVARREALSEMGRDQVADTVDVVAVDQFEELFTSTAPHKTDRFIARITDHADPTRWVVTVRADFLGDLLAHPELGRKLQESLVLVPPLEDHEVEAAIIEPARRVGVGVEASLVATVVRDVQSRASALPLMQYALTDLFDRRRGDVLTLDAYEREGALSGALVRRADQVLQRLSPQGRDAARQIFLQLVTIADNGEFARRRVRRDILAASETRLTDQILEQFGAQRLLTFDEDPTSSHATVELAHESLLEVWPRLSRWIDEAREELLMRSTLNTALAEWEASDRDESFLLSGGRLAQHESWTAETDLALTANEIGFLAESQRNAEYVRARRRKRRNWITAGFGLAAAVATVFGIVALQQAEGAASAAEAARVNEQLALEKEQEAIEALERASDSEDRATESARVAAAKALIASASAVMEEDAQLALLLALEGASMVPEDLDALRVLRQALRAPVTLYTGDLDPRSFRWNAHMSPDGGALVGTGESGVELRKVDTGETLWVYEPGVARSSDWVPAFVNGGSEVAVGLAWQPQPGDEFVEPPEAVGVQILDAKTGTLKRRIDTGPCGALLAPWSRTVGDAGVVTVEITPDWYDEHGCNLDDSGVTEVRNRILDVNTGALVEVGEPFEFGPRAPGFAFTFDAVGRYRLFYSRNDDLVTIEEIATGREVFRLPSAPITAQVEISPDGTLVVLGGASEIGSRELRVYEMSTVEEVSVLEGHSGETIAAKFTDDSEQLISTGEDGLIKIWDPRTGDLIQTITTTGDVNDFLWLSGDGSRIGTLGKQSVNVVSIAEADSAEIGALKICTDGQPFYVVRGLQVQGDRALVFGSCSASQGGQGWVFDLDTNSVVAEGPPANSQGYALSPDGTGVASQEWTPSGEAGAGTHGTAVFTRLDSDQTVRMEGLCRWDSDIDDTGCEPSGEGSYAAWAREFDFSPDGRLIAMSVPGDMADGQVWFAESGESLGRWSFGTAAFTPDATKIATYDAPWISGRLEVRSTEDSSVLNSRLLGEGEYLDWIVISADGKKVVGVHGSDIVLYDIETLGEVDRWQRAHEAQINHLAVSENGLMLASTGVDGFAKVWDLETGELLHDFQVSGDDQGQAVAFANDDRHLLVSVEGGPLAIYTLQIDELFEIARGRLIRGFIGSECLQYFPDTDCPTLEEMRSSS